MKQTAVEFLESKIFGTDTFSLSEVFEQAKEMFEKQVRDAWNDGRYENTGCGDSEAYYDEIYNK